MSDAIGTFLSSFSFDLTYIDNFFKHGKFTTPEYVLNKGMNLKLSSMRFRVARNIPVGNTHLVFK
jgi:hypothetical protein